MFKTCSKCLKSLPICLFNIASQNKDGFKGQCNPCRKEYFSSRAEHFSKQNQIWRSNNSKRKAITRREWVRNNPEKHRLSEHKRRVSVQNSDASYTTTQWFTLLLCTGGMCLLCGEITELTVDHIKPLSLGGSNSIENIQPLCKPCNISKHIKEVSYL